MNFEFESNKEASLWFKAITISVSLSLFIILPLMSLKVGIPSDEPIDIAYGKASLKFYSSFGNDTSFANIVAYENKKFPFQKYYGASFEAGSVFISNVLSTPIFKTRHVLSALCGAVVILFTVLIAAELSGWFSAFIAVVLLIASPTLIGNSLFNSKDIPLAMGFAIAFYFFIRILKSLPILPLKNCIGAAIGITIAISIRMAGLLLIPYLIAFLLIFFSDKDEIRKSVFSSVNNSLKFIFTLLLISVSGSFVGFLFYPNFYLHGFSHVIQSMDLVKSFPVKIIMLFRGELIYAHEIPWNYLLICMGNTFPLTVLAGLLIYCISQKNILTKTPDWKNFILIYSSLFILVYTIAAHPLMYNGWRHVLFIYPVLIVSASIGYSWFFNRIKLLALRIVVIFIFFGFIGKTVFWMYDNHPYEYAYFNEINGGIKGANGYYETDYQQLGASASFNWLVNSKEFLKDTTSNKIIQTNNIALKYADLNLTDSIQFEEASFIRLTFRPMNYAIISSMFIEKNLVQNFYPPSGAIHIEKIDGVPVSCVVKSKNNFIPTGIKYFNEKNIDSAAVYLLKGYNSDPDNFRIWPLLGHCYDQNGDFEKALLLMKKYKSVFPDDEMVIGEINDINESIRKTKSL